MWTEITGPNYERKGLRYAGWGMTIGGTSPFFIGRARRQEFQWCALDLGHLLEADREGAVDIERLIAGLDMSAHYRMLDPRPLAEMEAHRSGAVAVRAFGGGSVGAAGGPAARSFAADAHDCIMVRIRTDLPNTSARREEAPQWRAPLGSQRTHRHRPDAEAMQKAPIAVHHRSACSGVKALRNTTAARRQAAKLC